MIPKLHPSRLVFVRFLAAGHLSIDATSLNELAMDSCNHVGSSKLFLMAFFSKCLGFAFVPNALILIFFVPETLIEARAGHPLI